MHYGRATMAGWQAQVARCDNKEQQGVKVTQQGVKVRCEVARRDNNTTRLSFEQGVEQQGVRAM